ncbi:MAG: 6,7-dimethyl-8-ribityllumazine synthase [Bacteroidia bacterium]|nr:6,7-dimethyl-8-ribityllumazine synthase [Bacteroidia bacterium]|tara:strand:+ start:54569 stop:55042 length:474 start_codon:yes stop_codon:yes gene_type:complete
MADYANQNFLSDKINLPHTNFKIAIVTAMWNGEITSRLKSGAIETLAKSGIPFKNITAWDVPGSYELIYAANKLANEGMDAIICIGVVIKGETPHFNFICDAVANGISQITIEQNIPIGFGVLTTSNKQQAIERAGGDHGHKGEEAAWTVLKLLERQ